MPEVAKRQLHFVCLIYFTIETEPQDLHDSVTLASCIDYDCQLADFPKGTDVTHPATLHCRRHAGGNNG